MKAYNFSLRLFLELTFCFFCPKQNAVWGDQDIGFRHASSGGYVRPFDRAAWDDRPKLPRTPHHSNFVMPGDLPPKRTFIKMPSEDSGVETEANYMRFGAPRGELYRSYDAHGWDQQRLASRLPEKDLLRRRIFTDYETSHRGLDDAYNYRSLPSEMVGYEDTSRLTYEPLRAPLPPYDPRMDRRRRLYGRFASQDGLPRDGDMNHHLSKTDSNFSHDT